MLCVSETSPNPFNHGMASINYESIPADTKEIITRLLHNTWGIHAIEDVLKYARHGAYSNNYLIMTPGSNYVLRESKLNSPLFQNAIDTFTDYLHVHGFPVPQSISGIHGIRYFIKNKHIFSLCHEIKGEHFDGSITELKNAAEMLAHFHGIAKEYPFAHTLTIDNNVYTGDLNSLHRIEQRARAGHSTFDAFALDVINMVKTRHNRYPSNYSLLPQQIGHFDWNPHNLIFDVQNKSILGLLDFDLLQISQRARDVGLGMHKFSRVFGDNTEKKQNRGSTIVARAKTFLEAYLRINPLNQHEVHYIPALVFNETAKKIIYILSKHYFSNDTTSNFDLEKQLTLILEMDMFSDLGNGMH